MHLEAVLARCRSLGPDGLAAHIATLESAASINTEALLPDHLPALAQTEAGRELSNLLAETPGIAELARALVLSDVVHKPADALGNIEHGIELIWRLSQASVARELSVWLAREHANAAACDMAGCAAGPMAAVFTEGLMSIDIQSVVDWLRGDPRALRDLVDYQDESGSATDLLYQLFTDANTVRSILELARIDVWRELVDLVAEIPTLNTPHLADTVEEAFSEEALELAAAPFASAPVGVDNPQATIALLATAVGLVQLLASLGGRLLGVATLVVVESLPVEAAVSGRISWRDRLRRLV